MRPQRLVAAAFGLAVALTAIPACAAGSTPAPKTSAATQATTATASPGKTAVTYDGTPRVGALFLSAVVPLHICTASVVRSANRSVIMTAAHCIQGGTAAGYQFAPGYHDGKAPYGMWRVTAAYGAPGWIHHANSRDDFAFLVVAARSVNGKTQRLQAVTGANELGSKPAKGVRVRVPAYPLSANSPITCAARVFIDGAFPGFHCGGYSDGTSGAPWLAGHGARRSVVGVIGGLHQGGCEASTSYTSPLGTTARKVLRRAGHSGRPDSFPRPPSDGC